MFKNYHNSLVELVINGFTINAFAYIAQGLIWFAFECEFFGLFDIKG
jgi:hypothetical protein